MSTEASPAAPAPVEVKTGTTAVPVEEALKAASEKAPAPAKPAEKKSEAPKLPAWLEAGVAKLAASQRQELSGFIEMAKDLARVLKSNQSPLVPEFGFEPVPKIKLVLNRTHCHVVIQGRRIGTGGYVPEVQFYAFLAKGDLEALKALLKQVPHVIRELNHTFQRPSGI